MPEILLSLRYWMAGCFLLGAVTGAFVRRTPERGDVSGWLLWTGAAALAGGAALWLGAISGPPSFYLLTALAFYAAFLPGAAVGARVAGGDLRAHEGWATGLAPLCLIWLAAIGAGLLQPASTPRQDKNAEATAAPDTPNPVAAASPDATQAGPPANPSTSVAATPTEACQRVLTAAASLREMTFAPGKATISRRMSVALDAIAAAIRDCAIGAIEIAAGGDGGADPADRTLAQKRAEAVALYLRREGLGGRTVQPADASANAEAKAGSLTFIAR
jgi:outer membrane protein OmpA-like peptidoglycan-associated protein